MIKFSGIQPFELLIPECSDVSKIDLRIRLLSILASEGEILPPAESPLGKLWHLLNSPKTSMEQCEQIIQLDPELAARLSRLAGAAIFGRKSGSVSDSLHVIGFKNLRDIIFSNGVFSQLSQLKAPEGWDRFWLRNIFVARLTERIAAMYFPSDGSEYLAGLLHDVGWLFLATYFPKELDEILTLGGPLREAEAGVLSFSHADIGAAIAARSLLPPRAINAIGGHVQPDVGDFHLVKSENWEQNCLSVILFLCDKVANSYLLDFFGQSDSTIEAIENCPSAAWLKEYGNLPSLKDFAEEELPKAQGLYSVFFENQ